MGILESIQGFFQKKAIQKLGNKLAKDVLPNFIEKVKEHKDLQEAAEDTLKDKLKELAQEYLEAEIDKRLQIPEKLQPHKSKILEIAVDQLVDIASDQAKEAISS
ncbi:MAG: hypothetical protein D6805_08545 [Planctomycetota bacterium]|nr:MAG: hypothetical protein D6805_08545 [Planctomycetota bacterium]